MYIIQRRIIKRNNRIKKLFTIEKILKGRVVLRNRKKFNFAETIRYLTWYIRIEDIIVLTVFQKNIYLYTNAW